LARGLRAIAVTGGRPANRQRRSAKGPQRWPEEPVSFVMMVMTARSFGWSGRRWSKQDMGNFWRRAAR